MNDCNVKISNNKAGYMATPVACGWAGAVLRSLDHLGRGVRAKIAKTAKE